MYRLMSQPEIIPYGDNPFGERPEYEGILYRFDEAEHIGIEKSADNISVYASTDHGPEAVAEFYEHIFGIPAVVEPLPDDEALDDDESDDSNLVVSASISLGPRIHIIARNQDFGLFRQTPWQVFWDREAETAKVNMYQAGAQLDFRHKALWALIVEKNTGLLLDEILKDY